MLHVDCVPDEGVCCVEMFGVAHNVLVAVYDDLRNCYPQSTTDPLVAYVTMGAGDDGVLDSLTVAVTGVRPSTGSSVNGTQRGPLLIRGSFDVRLRESGWPMVRVDGSTVTLPDPVKQNEAARQSFAHGERMYRKLLRMRALGEFAGDISTLRGAHVEVGQLSPLNPLGGSVGWLVPFTIDLAWGGG